MERLSRDNVANIHEIESISGSFKVERNQPP